jgi:hypothetical protein
VLQTERGVSEDPHRHGQQGRLHEAVPAEPGVVRQGQLLPAELEVHQREHGALQALLAQRGGVRKEVLRPKDESLLRKGRLLPEGPIVLRHGQDAALLPVRPEVCDSDPRRRHRRETRHGVHLLPLRPLQQEPRALLPARPGRTQHTRLPDPAARHQPVLLSAWPDLWIRCEQDLREHAIGFPELRQLRERLRVRNLSRRDLRPSVIAC